MCFTSLAKRGGPTRNRVECWWRFLAPQVRTIKHPYFPNKYTKAANLLHLNLAIQRHSKYSCRESSTIASDGPPPFERRYHVPQIVSMLNNFQFVELKTTGADFLVSSLSLYYAVKFLHALLLFYSFSFCLNFGFHFLY